MPPLLGLLLPEGQATADPCFQRRHSKTRLAESIVGGTVRFPGSWCTQGLFVPLEQLWWVWGLILNVTAPFLLSCCGFSFARGHGLSYLHGFQHHLFMIVQQLVEILVSLSENMSAHPSVPPSCITSTSYRDGNTRPPYLPPEKPLCRSRSNSEN